MQKNGASVTSKDVQLPKLDDIDRKILAVLQNDASLSVSEVAAQVGL